jgi:hypothetical protein
MPFKGFNLKYPEYEVITPHTHLSFSLRSLSVSEEEKLKGSLMTPTKITEHLNKCLYENSVQKPATITDYKSFLKSLSLKDRDALLYGLYHITYEEIRNYDIRCSSCRKEYPVTVKASEMFNNEPYVGEDSLTKRLKVDLPVSKGVSAYIRQPSLDDEETAIRTLSATPGLTIEIITETLIVERFEQLGEDAVVDVADPVVYTSRYEIIDAYRSLPARDKRTIYEKYNEEFGKFGIKLKMRTFCTHCGFEEVVDVDLVENFFRMVYSS